ncbi:MAG: protein-disulfide reductase DsbD domain-containing protein [Candidatus Dadabacteria bacterium]
MKRYILSIITIISFTIASAQLTMPGFSPVNWNFTSKKVANDLYEIQLTATIQQGWHLYSQSQPGDAIAIPTSFSFNKNPLLNFDGKVKEVGKLEKYKDEVLGVTANQYSDKVVFVQKIKMKAKAKTSVTGKLEFQTCNNQKCLPPKTVNFSISLI